MLPLSAGERVKMLAAVTRRGGLYHPRRVAAITASLAILVAVPLSGTVRIDLWGGNHLLLGEPVTLITALKGFVVSMAVLYGFTFLTNMVVGRFFCGWGCPVGYVSRLGEEVAMHRRSRRKRLVHHALGAGFVATFIAAVMLWWVDPRVLVEGSLTARLVTGGVFLALCTGGFVHAFVWRFLFCVNFCPIGIYYRYVTSRAPVGIVFNEVPSPCIACGGCESICPVDLDPKALGLLQVRRDAAGEESEARYGDAECIRCGDCVEVCRMVYTKRAGETPPLRFGKTAEDRSHQSAEREAVAAVPHAQGP